MSEPLFSESVKVWEGKLRAHSRALTAHILVADGMRLRDVAEELGVSAATVSSLAAKGRRLSRYRPDKRWDDYVLTQAEERAVKSLSVGG